MFKSTLFLVSLIFISVVNIEIPKRAFRLYEKGDIEKTIEALEKSLEKEAINPAAKFLYSKVYIDTAFSGYNVDSAYAYINSAITNFKAVKDSKDLIDLKEVGVDSSSLEAVKDRVDALQFAIISKKHAIKDYNWFIEKHSDADQIPEAIRLRNHIAFEEASNENTWQRYKKFMEDYPLAVDFTEAETQYQKLLFEDKTEDGKLKSLSSFLEEHPGTPYRETVETAIFQIVTATNSIEDYTSFLKKYPNHALAKKAIPRLYHLYKTKFPDDDFFQLFKVETGRDSLKKAMELEQGIWLPKIEDGKINFINSLGEDVLNSAFEQINAECKCAPIQSDFVWGSKSGKQQILGRNGKLIFEGNFDEVVDTGFGYLILKDAEGERLIHKSGETIIGTPLSSITILNQHLIRTEKNGFFGLTTINQKPLLENEFVAIDTLGGFLWLQKDEGIALLKPETLYPAIDGETVKIQFKYDDVERLESGDFLVSRNQKEALLNTGLKEKIPFGDYKIYPKNYGWQLRSLQGIQVFHKDHPALQDSVYQKAEENEHWLALKKGKKWTLIDQTGNKPTQYGLDSLGIWGENMVMIQKGKKTFAQFSNGKQLEMETAWQPKLLVPQNYISTGGKTEFDFFMLSNSKKYRKVYNRYGKEILSATFDDVVPLNPNLLRLQKRNAALADSTGNYILNFIYDGIGSNDKGYVSILDKGKVGVINVSKKIKIPPTYDKLLEPYSDTVMVASKGKYKGFINTANKELSAFDYDEVRYFTDTVALARIENEWFLHRIKDETLLYEGILDYTILKEGPNEKRMLITTEKGTGIYSNVHQQIIAPTYDQIKVLGTEDEPIYFAVKVVKEANIYVVIYFDKNGNKLFTQSFKQDEYFKIACPTN